MGQGLAILRARGCGAREDDGLGLKYFVWLLRRLVAAALFHRVTHLPGTFLANLRLRLSAAGSC
jgi:hypothetical protein